MKFTLTAADRGEIFREDIKAPTRPIAEAMAHERLCEAFGYDRAEYATYDELPCHALELDQWGPEEYARDATFDLLAALEKAELFIEGFVGDELQEGIDKLHAEIRAALDKAQPFEEINAVAVVGADGADIFAAINRHGKDAATPAPWQMHPNPVRELGWMISRAAIKEGSPGVHIGNVFSQEDAQFIVSARNMGVAK